MKSTPFILLSAALLFFLASPAMILSAPVLAVVPTCTLVMERPESAEIKDMIPVTVLVNTLEVGKLAGGDKKPITAPAGAITISVRSRNPSSIDTLPPLWESNTMALTMGSGQSVSLIVKAATGDKGFTGAWDLQKTEK
jgi:hypothetical protein